MLDVSLQVVQILASDTLVAAALASKRVSHWPSARCSLTPAHGAGALLRLLLGNLRSALLIGRPWQPGESGCVRSSLHGYGQHAVIVYYTLCMA